MGSVTFLCSLLYTHLQRRERYRRCEQLLSHVICMYKEREPAPPTAEPWYDSRTDNAAVEAASCLRLRTVASHVAAPGEPMAGGAHVLCTCKSISRISVNRSRRSMGSCSITAERQEGREGERAVIRRRHSRLRSQLAPHRTQSTRRAASARAAHSLSR